MQRSRNEKHPEFFKYVVYKYSKLKHRLELTKSFSNLEVFDDF